jgi:AmmeMemoRadiSam system protein B
MIAIRKPAVAGTFYPGNARQLADMLDGFEPLHPIQSDQWPKAVIAPHAGYVYSGPIAASVYGRLGPGRSHISRVVILGPAHRVAFRAVAAPSVEAFATPLGDVRVDRATVRRLEEQNRVVIRDDAHADEHGLEVHLPFLQRALVDFEVVPLVIGDVPYPEVADILREVWGGPETLVVISSDLSHYYPYDTAQRMDKRTAEQIEELDPLAIGVEQACGRTGIQALLKVAREKGLSAERIDLRNSGDTAGPREQVVGYGAFAFE